MCDLNLSVLDAVFTIVIGIATVVILSKQFELGEKQFEFNKLSEVNRRFDVLLSSFKSTKNSLFIDLNGKESRGTDVLERMFNSYKQDLLRLNTSKQGSTTILTTEPKSINLIPKDTRIESLTLNALPVFNSAISPYLGDIKSICTYLLEHKAEVGYRFEEFKSQLSQKELLLLYNLSLTDEGEFLRKVNKRFFLFKDVI